MPEKSALFFSMRWILTTLLVIAAAAFLFRLGIWQLERLEQRRSFNARVNAQVIAPTLNLNESMPSADHLPELEYRKVVVSGEFDFSQEIVLRNQPMDGLPGFRIFTPLRISGSQACILVDRGWIPLTNGATQVREKYFVSGPVKIEGVIRRSMVEPTFGGVPDPTLSPGQPRMDAWNFIDISQIQKQVPYALLPVYIQQSPQASGSSFPAASVDTPDLTEGSHLSYAIQWFSFAAVLAIGYPFFVRRSLKSNKTKQN